jgi:hypothetical protein
LPGAGILGDISIFIRKGDAKLNHLEQVHVASQGLIVIVGRCAKVAFKLILFRSDVSPPTLLRVFHLMDHQVLWKRLQHTNRSGNNARELCVL